MYLQTEVKLGADGAFESECDVTAAVATVVALSVVCRGGRRTRATLKRHDFDKLNTLESRKVQKENACLQASVPSAIFTVT